jgi:hypothetical protein
MDDLDRTQLEQVLKLAKENNKMLRAMRRNAWIGGFLKLILWAAFIILPLWLYMTYLAPVMEGMMQTMNQIQGANAQAQAQFGELNGYMQKLQGFMGGGQ